MTRQIVVEFARESVFGQKKGLHNIKDEMGNDTQRKFRLFFKTRGPFST